MNDFATDYIRQELSLAHVHGNTDDFVYNSIDRRLMSQGLFGVHEGDSIEVRHAFNSAFNYIISYHSSLWRDTPADQRNPEYYAHRYSRFFEDLFRLCEKFPHLPIQHEYVSFLAAFNHYQALGELYAHRKEIREQEAFRMHVNEARIAEKNWREKVHADEPHICPRCGSRAYFLDYYSSGECKVCRFSSL